MAKKSAKELIDNLVDAVQDYDAEMNHGSRIYEREKRAAYMKARRELRDALRGNWPAKEVIKNCQTCRVYDKTAGHGGPECTGCVIEYGTVFKNWRRR